MKIEKDNAAVKWFKDVAKLIKGNKKNTIIVAAFALIVIVGIVIGVVSGKKPDQEVVAPETEQISEE